MLELPIQYCISGACPSTLVTADLANPCACRSHTGKAFVKLVIELGSDKVDDAAKYLTILALRTMRVQASIHNAEAVAAATHTLQTTKEFTLPVEISKMTRQQSFTVQLSCPSKDIVESIESECSTS